MKGGSGGEYTEAKNSKCIAGLSSAENSSMPLMHKHYMQKPKPLLYSSGYPLCINIHSKDCCCHNTVSLKYWK